MEINRPNTSQKMNKKRLPSLSIIIVIKNVERTIAGVLERIAVQDYPREKIEILVIDGKSTDRSLDIIKDFKLPIKIYQSEYPDDPESSRAVGLRKAKGEIVVYIDSDNYLPHSKWITKMIVPFLEHPEIVGTEVWRYGYRKMDNYLNRYFALMGSADVAAMALGTADKVSYLYDHWNLYGKIISEKTNYFVIEFQIGYFPTIGSNGFFAWRKLLLKAKSSPLYYVHTDIPIDLAHLGYNKYAIVKDTIIHDTAESMLKFLRKRGHYMRILYQQRARYRRYLIFDPKRLRDWYHLILFIFFACTFIQPLLVALRGYIKKRDTAWFVHPVFSFLLMLTYGWAVISRFVVGDKK